MLFRSLYARTTDGRLFNLDRPTQALLMVGEDLTMRPLEARERRKRPTRRARRDEQPRTED